MVRRGVALELKGLFGTSLRQCHRARGLTQAQLAEATDLSLEMIGRLERGLMAPSFETVAALATALQVAPAVLFGGEPSTITGERREVLDRINKALASTSDRELKRAKRAVASVSTRACKQIAIDRISDAC
jgi:transcriptional regulator with XRE-family HTH domain